MKNFRFVVAAGLAALLFVAVSQAEVLLVDRIDRFDESAMPTTGQSMAQVEAAYGNPDGRSEAVGQPPITRWVYAGFTVYFEHNLVIDSVANAGPKDQPVPVDG